MAKQQKSKKKKLNKSLVFILPIVVVLLATGAFFAYRYLPLFNQDEERTTENKMDDLTGQMMDGDIDKAAGGYDDLLKKASNDKDKAQIYLDRAWSYIEYGNTENLKLAKEDAMSAEKLDPTVSSALALKTIGEKQNDKNLTAEYEAKYNERMKEHDLPGGP